MGALHLAVPALLLGSLALAGCTGEDAPTEDAATSGSTGTGGPSAMGLLSSSFSDGGAIPRKHSCDGEQVSPPLSITGVPPATVSLVLLVKDPDVPTPQAPTRTIVHWKVWSIDPAATVFPEGGVPAWSHDGGSEFGPGWRGPCPPPTSPPHRYNFTAYALDVDPSLPDNATAEQVEEAMDGHVLDQATLIGLYQRQVVASSSTAPVTTPSG